MMWKPDGYRGKFLLDDQEILVLPLIHNPQVAQVVHMALVHQVALDQKRQK